MANPSPVVPELSLSQAAAELQIGYGVARDLALRGELEVRFEGHRMFVTAGSVAAYKARREAERVAAERAFTERATAEGKAAS